MSSPGSTRRTQAAAILRRTRVALARAASPRRHPAGLAAAALLAACSDATAPRSVAIEPSAQPRFQVSDAARGGRAGFYLLPPLVADPGPFTGTFDGGLPATARVCQLDAARTACTTDVQTFAVGAAGGQAITVSTGGQSYNATWVATRDLALSGNAASNVRYRLEVAVGGTTLGFADLWVAKDAKGLKSLPAGYVGLVQGMPLPIKFRIETRAVGTVTVAPSTASVPVGGTQAFTAIVTDLRGNAASAANVAWTTSAATVATLSAATGGTTTATGAGVGTATITASVGGVAAGTTLTVVATAAAVSVHDQYGTTAGAALTVRDGSTDLLANDNLGTPAATLTSFGGSSLGGAVTDHAAGTTATAGTGGALQVNANGSLTYTPAAGFTGPFTFQYRLTNATGSVDATVTINVAKAPSAVTDAYTTPRNTALVTAAPGLLANDDRGAPQGAIARFAVGTLGAAGTGTAAGTTIPDGNGGTLQVNGDGSFTFTPANANTAAVSFQYELANAAGASVGTATITVTEAPVAQADAYTATDGTRTLAAPGVLANDTRGAPQSVVASFGGGSLGGAVTDRAAGTTASFGTGGSLSVSADGSVSFTRSAGFSGDFTVQYRLTSASGSSDATVTITVPAPVETPPTVYSATQLQELDCRIAIAAQTVTCSRSGGAGDHVAFAVANVSVNGGVVRFGATIRNLLTEAIGTPDGVVLDPAGIAAVIATGPTVVGGTGTAAFSNADGTRDYGSGQKPYFAWHERLATDAVSAGKTWELRYGAGVTAVEFRVAVLAEVQPLLVINEIMVNPSGTSIEQSGEWFEVYNRGRLPVQMQGLLISDSAASGPRPPHSIANSLVVQPGGFAVLGNSTNTTLNGGAPVDYAYGGALTFISSLRALKISRVYGTDTLTIDYAQYAHTAISAKDGISRELRNPLVDNGDIDGSWWADALATAVYGAGGRGTPKAQNSTYTP